MDLMNNLTLFSTSITAPHSPGPAKKYIEHSKSENTKRAYRNDWSNFATWCAENGLPSLPAAPTTVADFITHLADTGKYKVSTIERHLVAISQAHKLKGYSTAPTAEAYVRETIKGIRVKLGTRQIGKQPLVTEDILELLHYVPEKLTGRRDKALLLMGFSGAFRRSELASLEVIDLSFDKKEGMEVMIRRSKTDQEGAGRKVAIMRGTHSTTCPVIAVREWLRLARISSGPVFRAIDRHGHMSPKAITDKTVANIVKKYCELAGKNPIQFAGHSLRAGFATAAAEAGASERAIMKQTGHRSEKMVRKYIREGTLFKDNASGMLGL